MAKLNRYQITFPMFRKNCGHCEIAEFPGTEDPYCDGTRKGYLCRLNRLKCIEYNCKVLKKCKVVEKGMKAREGK